jgi:hypothetical protein
MIDISSEHLIAIRDVPKILPARGNGKHIHISAVYRWLLRGVRGVRLETIRIGGTSYTSSEAVQRFAEHLSRPNTSGTSSHAVTSANRRRQIEEASRRVAAILGQANPDPPHGMH